MIMNVCLLDLFNHACSWAVSLCALSSGTLWAAWSCWWQKITWLFTWMEQLLAGRCPASAGWRGVTRWLTGSENDKLSNRANVADLMIQHELIVILHFYQSKHFQPDCLLQAEEESKVSHHRSPNMVHQDCPGHLKTFHQVRLNDPPARLGSCKLTKDDLHWSTCMQSQTVAFSRDHFWQQFAHCWCFLQREVHG